MRQGAYLTAYDAARSELSEVSGNSNGFAFGKNRSKKLPLLWSRFLIHRHKSLLQISSLQPIPSNCFSAPPPQSPYQNPS